MYRIKRIQFSNHKILGNLELDFTDRSGKAVDTVILAGENGVGKSVILNALYSYASCKPSDCAQMVVEIDRQREVTLSYYKKTAFGSRDVWVNDNAGLNTIASTNSFSEKYNFNGIFSDVDIIFESANINSVTSMQLDEACKSRKSTKNLPQQINQLLVDIQSIDDSNLSEAYREATETGKDTNTIDVPQRMQRFIGAFDSMFDNLKYYRIVNENGHKSILFKKGDTIIPIDMIVYGL